jgi:hypothetical protein
VMIRLGSPQENTYFLRPFLRDFCHVVRCRS